jgi:hypothetical protein
MREDAAYSSPSRMRCQSSSVCSKEGSRAGAHGRGDEQPLKCSRSCRTTAHQNDGGGSPCPAPSPTHDAGCEPTPRAHRHSELTGHRVHGPPSATGERLAQELSSADDVDALLRSPELEPLQPHALEAGLRALAATVPLLLRDPREDRHEKRPHRAVLFQPGLLDADDLDALLVEGRDDLEVADHRSAEPVECPAAGAGSSARQEGALMVPIRFQRPARRTSRPGLTRSWPSAQRDEAAWIGRVVPSPKE